MKTWSNPAGGESLDRQRVMWEFQEDAGVSMDYLHYEFDLAADDVVEVTLDGPANVRLLDDTNYALYSSGSKHRYYGGHVKEARFTIPAPRAGHWHVVIDLGGYAGTVRASASVLRGVA